MAQHYPYVVTPSIAAKAPVSKTVDQDAGAEQGAQRVGDLQATWWRNYDSTPKGNLRVLSWAAPHVWLYDEEAAFWDLQVKCNYFLSDERGQSSPRG